MKCPIIVCGVVLGGLVLGSCVSSRPVPADAFVTIDGLNYGLVSETSAYLVREPFQFRLHVENPSGSRQELPRVLDAGYELHVRGPGWSSVEYSEPMTQLLALGKIAVPALLANLTNYAVEVPVIQLLGDLKVTEAVPLLLDRLWMRDDPHDSLIIARLAEITEHPDGYGFHRRWFDERTQQAAVRAYRDWWAKYQREHRDSAKSATRPGGRESQSSSR